ncbi:Imm8 family immunity protein [Gemmobacter denitrificans]|uniref:Imm8 family immunity protein n=1 Tax=Gemmobacter denitrificans TaxID=3123040 RepID=A0ABU8BT78_9RHOB
MKARVMSLDIQGTHGEAYWPENREYFCALLDITIGPSEGDAGDIFQATVCSPSWFADNVLKTWREDPTHEYVEPAPQFGRHYLFANTFDEETIRSAVEKWVGDQAAGDWPTLAQRLSRNLAWEFEDYQPYQEDASG